MPTIQCPHCKHEARVPSLDKIGGKNVKCPSCGQTFHVEPQAPEVPNVDTNDFAFRGPAPEFSPPQGPSTNSSSHRQQTESLFNPLTYDPHGATSAQRYPNLLRYIALSETLITLLFKLSMALIVIALVVGEIRTVLLMGDLGIFHSLIIMIGAALAAVLYALLLWLFFIFYMAITEFVRVVIDIENNTRG